MQFFDQIKTGGFADPSTLQGAFLFAVIFAFLAWIVGRALRLAVQRMLAHDKHDRVDLMAVKFLATLVRYCCTTIRYFDGAQNASTSWIRIAPVTVRCASGIVSSAETSCMEMMR